MMDSDDMVIIESEPPPSNDVSHLCLQKAPTIHDDTDSDDKSESDTRPVVHTNNMFGIGKYRFHNYLHDTNDNCPYCHDFLLQAYREKDHGVFLSSSMVVPVCCADMSGILSLIDLKASTTTAAATDANAFSSTLR